METKGPDAGDSRPSAPSVSVPHSLAPEELVRQWLWLQLLAQKVTVHLLEWLRFSRQPEPRSGGDSFSSLKVSGQHAGKGFQIPSEVTGISLGDYIVRAKWTTPWDTVFLLCRNSCC